MFQQQQQQREQSSAEFHNFAPRRSRVAHLQSCVSGGSLIVLNTAKGGVFKANSVGARIWNGLESGLTDAEIAAGLSTEFNVSLGVVQQDLARFMRQIETECIN